MKKQRLWLKTALLIGLVAVVAFAVPVTLSYIFDKTDPVVNTFVPPDGLHAATAVNVNVVKTVVNSGKDEIGPGGFKFILENTETGEQMTAVSDFQGKAQFKLPFTGVDAGKSFFYRVYEFHDNREHVTYSDLVYSIRVDVAMAEDKPVAKVFLDEKETTNCLVAFENLYGQAEPPETGDAGHVALYMMLLVASAAAFLLVQHGMKRKRMNG